MYTRPRAIHGAAMALVVASQAPIAHADYPDFDYETGNIADVWGGANAMEADAIRMSGNYGTYLSVYNVNDYYHTVNPWSYGNSVWVTKNVSSGWDWVVNIGAGFSVGDGPGAQVVGGISPGQAGSIEYNFEFSGDNSLGNVQFDIGWFMDSYWVTDTTSGSATHGQSSDSFSGNLEEVDCDIWIYC